MLFRSIEVLTNITEEDHARREAQLRQWGVSHKVHWNQGGKGRPLARIVAERQPGVSVFIDDLAQHHASVAKHAPATWRLHMMGEPEVAPHISPAPDAHARIDRWADAEVWIREKLLGGVGAV